jgi:hypothetical protein
VDANSKNACFGVLIGSLESGQYIHVKKTSTPFAAWTALKDF